jgi:hypothetical protein
MTLANFAFIASFIILAIIAIRVRSIDQKLKERQELLKSAHRVTGGNDSIK